MFGASFALRYNRSRVVAADVEESAQNVVIAFNDEDRFAGNFATDVLSRIADSFGAAGDLPRAREDGLLF
jgi:hypothetical protein